MRFNRLNAFCFLSFVAMLVVLSSCSPAPRRVLNVEDKNTDFYWLFSQFNEYYAPLEYKESRHGFKYDALKAKYLALGQATTTNDQFYKLMYQFVSEFKDAHTSASLSNAALPARAKVAYLGFSGKRVGDKFLVTDLLPTIRTEKTNFPIKKGDLITKLGGATLKEAILSELVGWRDLGQDEANFTYHMNTLFNRVSTANGLPTGDTAVLTVVREHKEFQVSLPWVIKDLYAFSNEQKAAVKKSSPGDKEPPSALGQLFQIGFLGWDGKIEPTAGWVGRLLREIPGYSFWNTYKFIDATPTWESRLAEDPSLELTGFETLSHERKIPANAIPINDAKTYPTYVTREKVVATDGKDTGASRLVAYMYLDTFSPKGGEEKAIAEVAATLQSIQTLGATDLVIDMINNGGGSLTLGMKLAQLLSNKKVVQPDIQFRLSETWLDNFEKASLLANSDAERELSRRVFAALTEDKAAGKRLSRGFSVEALEPFAFVPNEKLTTRLNIVLLVNEMCASMCDIFTAILKDNDLARVVGQKTMGAGGNVVEHPYAPNSHLTVRQTESLMVRKDGSYIENNGIEPDVAVTVSESVPHKYEAVREKALKLLLTESK